MLQKGESWNNGEGGLHGEMDGWKGSKEKEVEQGINYHKEPCENVLFYKLLMIDNNK